MRCPLPFLAFAFVAAATASGQTPRSRTDIGERVDAYVAPLIALRVFDGIVLVAHCDSILSQRVFGFASRELRIPVHPASRYRIASVSKAFTKVLIGKLADQHKLGLDEPVSRWLPNLPSAGKITVRMLLDHRSGVPSVNSIRYDEEAFEQNTLEMLVDSIAKLPLDFEPGASRRYSNGGYAVLARLVELIERAPFGLVLERELLRPLGLNETQHESKGAVIPDLATGYMPSPSSPGTMVKADFQETETKAGGGSLTSSARDMLKWARSVRRSSILRPETWDALFPAGNERIEWSGRSPGYNAYVLHERRSDLTVIVLSNNYGAGMTSDIAEAAIAIAKGNEPAPLAVTAPAPISTAVTGLAGRYNLPPGAIPVPPGTPMELRLSGQHLVVYLGATPVDVLVPQPGGKFLSRALWSLVVPHDAAAGTPASIEVRALYRDYSFRATRMP